MYTGTYLYQVTCRDKFHVIILHVMYTSYLTPAQLPPSIYMFSQSNKKTCDWFREESLKMLQFCILGQPAPSGPRARCTFWDAKNKGN